MALVVNLIGKDGFVIAADSRGTIGDPRGLTAMNDDQKKIFPVSRRCIIAVSGASELAAQVVDGLEKQLKDKKIEHIEEVAKEARKHAKQCYQNWFEKFTIKDRPAINMTVAGYTKDKKPKLYLLSSNLDFAPQLCPTGRMLHGIPQYATYLMHRFYDSNMKVSNLVKLAAFMISETATQDPKVGGPLKVCTITKKEGVKELSEQEVQKTVKTNQAKIHDVKSFFFEEKNK